ncbi:MAG TPA: hypothetical protein VHW47_06755, partial [Acidimicrobiales bacterium]|nr:hypothetical protein [Acidimicrobiales bacterium]
MRGTAEGRKTMEHRRGSWLRHVGAVTLLSTGILTGVSGMVAGPAGATPPSTVFGGGYCPQTYVVPSTVTAVTITAVGGSGQAGRSSTVAGGGAGGQGAV